MFCLEAVASSNGRTNAPRQLSHSLSSCLNTRIEPLFLHTVLLLRLVRVTEGGTYYQEKLCQRLSVQKFKITYAS